MIDPPFTFTVENGRVRCHERKMTHMTPTLEHPTAVEPAPRSPSADCPACWGSGYLATADDEVGPCDHPSCSYWTSREIVVPLDADQDTVDRACDDAGRPHGAEDQGDPDLAWVEATIVHLKAVGLIV